MSEEIKRELDELIEQVKQITETLLKINSELQKTIEMNLKLRKELKKEILKALKPYLEAVKAKKAVKKALRTKKVMEFFKEKDKQPAWKSREEIEHQGLMEFVKRLEAEIEDTKKRVGIV